MLEPNIDKLRRTTKGDLLLRYSIWRQKGWDRPVTVSLYALAKTTSGKWRLLHREVLAGYHSDAYCDDLAKGMADMWAVLNCVGDTYLYRGVRIPHGVELEPLPHKENPNVIRQTNT